MGKEKNDGGTRKEAFKNMLTHGEKRRDQCISSRMESTLKEDYWCNSQVLLNTLVLKSTFPLFLGTPSYILHKCWRIKLCRIRKLIINRRIWVVFLKFFFFLLLSFPDLHVYNNVLHINYVYDVETVVRRRYFVPITNI